MTILVVGTPLTSGGIDTKSTFILYENAMTGATVTAGGDVGRLHDWMTNIFYSAAAGTTNIDLTITEQGVNCVGLAGVNWSSGGVTAKFYTWNGSAYVLQCDLNGTADGQPVMRVFQTVYATKVRIQFVATSTLYVGEAAFGLALQMPSLPAVGLQPAEWSDEDDVTISQTQALNFGASTVQKRGSEQVMQFNYITPDFMDNQFRTFRLLAKGRPVWCGWNQTDRLSSVVFGHWSASKPKFDSSYFTSLALTIRGAV